ncbi:MAG: di-heme oxidoredictase family protein [Acidimicrobiales bacterium]
MVFVAMGACSGTDQPESTASDDVAETTAGGSSGSDTVLVVPDGPPLGERLHPRLGGQTTAFVDNEKAFNIPARNMGRPDDIRFVEANVVFERSFRENEGLGPRFSASSCTGCHVNNGRSPGAAEGEELGEGFVVLSVDDRTRALFGERLETLAVEGEIPEGPASVYWQTSIGAYPDGTVYELRSPEVLAAGGWLVPRIAPHVAGTGLLEAIPDEDLRALADPDDLDGDGISGRLRTAVDVTTGEEAIGRFGWRAGQPTVAAQTATAFAKDMGLLTGLDPNIADPEVDHDRAELAAFYASALAVPAQRAADDPDVRAGADLFEQVGCASCHTPSFTTERVETRALSEQDIWPFTDLLLHDMGSGLNEPSSDPAVSDTEWRTPPLWGLGLHATVNGNDALLHDGRARTVEEAILWHAGEALPSTNAFKSLDATQRAQLLAFLHSL